MWATLDAEGAPSVATLMEGRHRPHVSLVVAERLEPDLVAEALDGMAIVPSFGLTFLFVGEFLGRVLWLGPAPTVALLQHQAQVYDRIRAAGLDVWEQYRPGRWVPHCTLSMRVPNSLMGVAVRRCLEVVPIEATLVEAAVTDHARGISHVIG